VNDLKRDIEIDKAEKIEDEKTGVTGLEIEYINENGDKKRVVFDDYEDSKKECEECGKPRYECCLEKDKAVKPPEEREHGSRSRASGETRKRKDVKKELNI